MADKPRPLSKAELKAIHAAEFDQPLVEDRERDKKTVKALREHTPDQIQDNPPAN